jgi:hypothetical protein
MMLVRMRLDELVEGWLVWSPCHLSGCCRRDTTARRLFGGPLRVRTGLVEVVLVSILLSPSLYSPSCGGVSSRDDKLSECPRSDPHSAYYNVAGPLVAAYCNYTAPNTHAEHGEDLLL